MVLLLLVSSLFAAACSGSTEAPLRLRRVLLLLLELIGAPRLWTLPCRCLLRRCRAAASLGPAGAWPAGGGAVGLERQAGGEVLGSQLSQGRLFCLDGQKALASVDAAAVGNVPVEEKGLTAVRDEGVGGCG